MAFTVDMTAAARRNLQAADLLLPGPRLDVAGYLYGIAAECAIKAILIRIGNRVPEDQMDPFWAHFPSLRTILRDRPPVGRSGAGLMRFINNDSFMNNWDIKMRYTHQSNISKVWVDSWSQQAREIVNSIESI